MTRLAARRSSTCAPSALHPAEGPAAWSSSLTISRQVRRGKHGHLFRSSSSRAQLFKQVAIDLFKCPASNDLIVSAESVRPVFVHGNLWIGDGDLDEHRLNEWATYSRVGATNWLNLHFAPTASSLAEVESLDERRCLALARAGTELEELVRRYSRRRLAVENVPWERRSDYPIDRVAIDPVALSRIVEEHEIGFILDLAHVRLAAMELECDPWDLLDHYPCRRIVELHVAGIAPDDEGRLRDSMPLADADWSIVQGALDRIADGRWRAPSVVVLEYGGEGEHFAWRTDREAIVSQVERLRHELERRSLG
ncbi:MAG: DUF692 family protein [Planctomycetes bacterium]|nr:DUF692 family protein [Planctomycetota bacterium]